MSGPHTEPPADPEWLARYEAKMADLEKAREDRIRASVEEWRAVEEVVDRAHAARRERNRDPD